MFVIALRAPLVLVWQYRLQCSNRTYFGRVCCPRERTEHASLDPFVPRLERKLARALSLPQFTSTRLSARATHSRLPHHRLENSGRTMAPKLQQCARCKSFCQCTLPLARLAVRALMGYGGIAGEMGGKDKGLMQICGGCRYECYSCESVEARDMRFND